MTQTKAKPAKVLKQAKASAVPKQHVPTHHVPTHHVPTYRTVLVAACVGVLIGLLLRR